MINLALGLALFMSWLIPYTAVDRWIVNLVGFDFRHVVALAIILLLWAAVVVLFKRMRVAVVAGPMYILLACANALALLTLLVHACNAYQLVGSGGAVLGVDAIMAPSSSIMDSAEYYLRIVYPFVKFLLVVSTVALVVPLVRSIRRGVPLKPSDKG
jgi:hypothetical protein